MSIQTGDFAERATAAGDAETPLANSTRSRFALWLGLAIVIVCAGWASYLRLTQLTAWIGDPDQYVASGVPMMTTLDAYYSLRIARRYGAGTWIAHRAVPQRHYARPEQTDPNEWYDQREPRELPLLSATLVVLSRAFNDNIDNAALVLSPLLSSLFMIPLFLCCWRLGTPAAGVMGGLVATFCIEYYQRTGVGWVETDPLNLFFPWMVTLLFVAMHGGQSTRRLLLMSAAAGAVLYLFFRWYPKPGLTLLFVCALAIHLRLANVSWRRCVLCVATVILFANPAQFVTSVASLEDFGKRYLWSAATRTPDAASAIRFPEVWSTISEVQRLRLADSLQRILPSAGLAAFGLAGFLLFALRHWRRMAAFGPVIALGLLALVSSRRFLFYLAPLVGIGWGYIVCMITKGLFRLLAAARAETPSHVTGSSLYNFVRKVRFAAATPQLATLVSYLAIIGVFIVWFAPTPSRQFIPSPAIPASVFRELQVLADRLPPDSRIWTWWDLGFAIVDATNFGVYHDGAAQYTPQTNLIAASFVSSSQQLMHDLIGFVDREGNRGIRNLAKVATSADDFVVRIRGAPHVPANVPIFVLFTPDMMLKYPSMRTLATLDVGATARSSTLGIVWPVCEKIVDDVLYCAKETVDLRTGLISQRATQIVQPKQTGQLRRALIIERGGIVRERDYSGAAELTLEIVMQAGAVKGVYLLDARAFESNLNQMYFLGHFDSMRFEEVYNNFPYARVFRALNTSN